MPFATSRQGITLLVNLIVSGGISNIDDVIKVKELNPFGVILGKALYENRVTIEEAKGI